MRRPFLFLAAVATVVVLVVPVDVGSLIFNGAALLGAYTAGRWLWHALGPLFVDEPARLPIDLDGGMRRRHRPTER